MPHYLPIYSPGIHTFIYIYTHCITITFGVLLFYNEQSTLLYARPFYTVILLILRFPPVYFRRGFYQPLTSLFSIVLYAFYVSLLVLAAAPDSPQSFPSSIFYIYFFISFLNNMVSSSNSIIYLPLSTYLLTLCTV